MDFESFGLLNQLQKKKQQKQKIPTKNKEINNNNKAYTHTKKHTHTHHCPHVSRPSSPQVRRRLAQAILPWTELGAPATVVLLT